MLLYILLDYSPSAPLSSTWPVLPIKQMALLARTASCHAIVSFFFHNPAPPPPPFTFCIPVKQSAVSAFVRIFDT